MDWVQLLISVFLAFLFGTVVLWFCSKVTNSPNATFKTALIFNGVMVLLGIGIGVIGGLGIGTALGPAFVIGMALLSLVFFFFLLMKLYEISFFTTIWLIIVVIAVNAVITRAGKILGG